MHDDTSALSRHGLKLLGWSVLLLGLPLALMAAASPPNTYQAMLGIDALDCDGPSAIYLFAIPAMLLYGAGFIVNALRWRRRFNFVVALVCALVCCAIMTNAAHAMFANSEQEAACLSR